MTENIVEKCLYPVNTQGYEKVLETEYYKVSYLPLHHLIGTYLKGNPERFSKGYAKTYSKPSRLAEKF